MCIHFRFIILLDESNYNKDTGKDLTVKPDNGVDIIATNELMRKSLSLNAIYGKVARSKGPSELTSPCSMIKRDQDFCYMAFFNQWLR